MDQGFKIKEQARAIFTQALSAVNAGAAVRSAVKLSGPLRLTVADEVYELTENQTRIYGIALGKAAYPMALALENQLGGKIIGGIVSGVLPEETSVDGSKLLSSKWRVFAGGHPLPDEASLAAARSCFNLLKTANNRQALVIFLISGGGSAMIEAPFDDSITLADLTETNRALVSCGATITEINAIRRCFSSIKGGGLAALAPRAAQISLIISDTEPGDAASVASGPTMESRSLALEEVKAIIKRSGLISRLPNSILDFLLNKPLEKPELTKEALRRYHVLLDNQSAVEAAVASAETFGLVVEVADNLRQQPVEIGCREHLLRMNNLLESVGQNGFACLISGGEFSCPVRGRGTGGRNSETALRMALMLGENNKYKEASSPQTVFLSAGTDGIDGNSPAARAISDNTTVERAKAAGFDALGYLENSDAYSFFDALGDTIVTGATGTNVRDLRIMIARK